MLLEHVHLLAQ